MTPKKPWIPISTGMVIAGAAASALWVGLAEDADGVRVPEAFTVASMQQELETPGGMTSLFQSKQYDDLTDEQRRQVARNKGTAYFQLWQGRADDYFEAGEARRAAMLDEHLAELMTQGGKTGKVKQKTEATKRQQPKSRKLSKGGWTKQQRKRKSESANPDAMARMAVYKTALTNRARARGLKLP